MSALSINGTTTPGYLCATYISNRAAIIKRGGCTGGRLLVPSARALTRLALEAKRANLMMYVTPVTDGPFPKPFVVCLMSSELIATAVEANGPITSEKNADQFIAFVDESLRQTPDQLVFVRVLSPSAAVREETVQRAAHIYGVRFLQDACAEATSDPIADAWNAVVMTTDAIARALSQQTELYDA